MRIRCYTLFDITETGVVGHFNAQRLPFHDHAGQAVTDLQSWNKSRNQQRNLETITQILQLRTQLFDVDSPVLNNTVWSFEFSVEFQGIYQDDNDEFGILKKDSDSVPMLVGLNEKCFLTPCLVPEGNQRNIWFEIVAVNTQL